MARLTEKEIRQLMQEQGRQLSQKHWDRYIAGKDIKWIFGIDPKMKQGKDFKVIYSETV